MNTSALHPTPRLSAVVRAQLRAVGVAVRRETIMAGLLFLGLTLLLAFDYLYDDGQPFSFVLSEMMLPIALLGVFAPMAVWRAEEPSRRSYLWALPVDRTQNTLVKVFGGWIWLMALVGAFLAWLLLIALVTGGSVGAREMQVLPANLPAELQLADDDPVVFRRIGMPVWMWLLPFTGATAAYLVGSIVVLASDHPWRWFAGVVFGFMLLVGLAAEVDREQALEAILSGPYGLEVLVTGVHAREVTTTIGGYQIPALVYRPAGDLWAVATILWTGLGLAGVLAAAFRHQER